MAAISAAELDATWRQLERVPRPDLARALARAQELGAAAFKRKDYQGAYDHYNQAVTGLEYLARTRTFRATSFQCFVASLVSFTISFPLSLFYKTKGSARWLILGAGALITIMMVKDWITILGLANAIVYKARASLGT